MGAADPDQLCRVRPTVALLCLLAAGVHCAQDGAVKQPSDSGSGAGPATYVYAGGGDSINRWRADLGTGALSWQDVVAAGDDARLAEVDRAGRRVYVQTQIGRPLALVSFDIAAADGGLSRSRDLLLPSPNVEGVTQIILHPQAPWLLLSATNASPGLEDQLMSVGRDGQLGMPKIIAYEFYGFAWDPSGTFFYGLDGEAIFQYRFDPAAGTITANDPAQAVGSSGRTVLGLGHHPSGKWTFSVEEDALGVYAREGDSGRLVAQSHLGNPVPGEPIYWTALALHPGGGLLYALGYFTGTRIAFVDVFAIDLDSGGLRFVERQAGDDRRRVVYTGLQAPLVLQDFVIVGGQSTASEHWGKPVLTVYRIDAHTGRLSALGDPLALRPAETARVNFLFALPAP